MQTGENEQALRKILDMTRLIAITILLLHYYFFLYRAFKEWGLTQSLLDRIVQHAQKTGLLSNFHISKLWALGFLVISLMGAKGKKDEKQNYKSAFAYIICGLLLYFSSYLCLYVALPQKPLATLYIGLSATGFLLVLSGGTLLSRIIKNNINSNDIFNAESETFPQEERKIDNEYSINLPATYKLKGKVRNSWVSFPAIFRSLICLGSPGAGKTAFVLRNFISQALGKKNPFTLLVYDFKFPDLSLIAYNHYLKNKHRYPGKPGCYFINFDDLSRSHRSNPLDPGAMEDITDASESARTILLNLNPEWKKKQGDFFSESAINFTTAVIWFLHNYQGGRYCTLPHVIETMNLEYDTLFTLLHCDETIATLVNPFISAYKADVLEQLEGQIASAKIAMARLSSPQLYYVLSGNEFSLDINNPEHPKVICMGNNPQKIQVYGAVLALYVNRMLKSINKKGKLKSMLIFDEFPTLTVDVIPTISTGRSNLISCVLGVQDASQLRKDYGREQADVIMNIVGNIISGQVSGDTAKQLSERIGKIMQERQSLSINSNDTSVSKNRQLDYAVPASKISALSSGEFVGVMADTPDQPIELKAFHCKIKADFDAIKAEETAYKPIPVLRTVNQAIVKKNFDDIKQDVQDIAQYVIEGLLSDPAKRHMVLRKR